MARKRPAVTPEMVARMARYLGCSGTHRGPNGELMPCGSHEELQRISNEAEPAKKQDGKKRKRRRVGGYEPLGERGVIAIDSLPGGGLVSGKDEFSEGFFPYELTDLKADNYTKPELRERLKRRIMEGSRGGKPGQWSARKAQLLALEYRRAGGGYRGGKKRPQRSLDKWTGEEWTTSDGKPAIREGGTNRYLPKKAWDKLTPAQRAATNRKKRRASREGRQFVANTERAREAGRQARSAVKSFLYGRAKPRVGDPDVFDNIDAARLRARQLGCIGVARRLTPDGVVVWTPCTNVSDYRRRTGVGEQARRDSRRAENNLIRRIAKKDADFYGADELAPIEVKAARRTLGALGGGGKRRLRPAAFNRDAEDADGDGLVQEGTTQERAAVPLAPKKPSRIDTIDLTADFNRPGQQKKKKPKPKQTPEERAAELARREERRQLDEARRQSVNQRMREHREQELETRRERVAARRQVDFTPPSGKSSPRQLLEERRARVEKRHGKIDNAGQAWAAFDKVYPNLKTMDLPLGKNRLVNPQDPLTPADKGLVYSLLDLGDRYPETAKSISGFGRNMPPEAPAGALGMAITTLSLNADDDSANLKFSMAFPDQTEKLTQVLVDAGKISKRTPKQPHTVSDYLFWDGETYTDDEMHELLGAVLATHEFGHSWHKTSTMSDEWRTPLSAMEFYSRFMRVKQEDLAAKRAEIRQQIIAAQPQISDSDLEAESLIGAIRFYQSQDVYKKRWKATLQDMAKDGLTLTQYKLLKAQGNLLSKYGGESAEEAIAERFAAIEALGYIPKQHVHIDTIWEFMGQRKSAEQSDDEDYVYIPEPYIDESEPGVLDIVMPGCSGNFAPLKRRRK